MSEQNLILLCQKSVIWGINQYHFIHNSIETQAEKYILQHNEIGEDSPLVPEPHVNAIVLCTGDVV